ncbi:MAG TPA: hypothetical protein VI233_13895 [Puia sp.]
MSEKLNLTDVPGEELIKILIDKVINTGAGLQELRDLIRKLLVRSEDLTEMELKFVRVEESLDAGRKTVTLASEMMEKGVDLNQEAIRMLTSVVNELRVKVCSELESISMILAHLNANELLTEIRRFRDEWHEFPAKKVYHVHCLDRLSSIYIGLSIGLLLLLFFIFRQF